MKKKNKFLLLSSTQFLKSSYVIQISNVIPQVDQDKKIWKGLY